SAATSSGETAMPTTSTYKPSSTGQTLPEAALEEGERPYAAVLALADRLELEADELKKLGTLRGASARLRHLLDLRLSAGIRETN
ncbi:hypothetical protein ACFYRF_44220, partial [Streptomyces sp. NPDC005548]